MKYYVFYLPNADKKVQDLIARAENPRAMTQTFDVIDRLLERKPLNIGESRYENVRVAFKVPLVCNTRYLKTTRR